MKEGRECNKTRGYHNWGEVPAETNGAKGKTMKISKEERVNKGITHIGGRC